jgi:hypothetical protein
MYKEKVCMMYRKVVIVCSVRCCSGACLCVQTQRPKRPRFRVQCVCVLVTGCLGGDVSLGCIRARSKDARHSKTGMLVTSNGRPWPRGSLLRDHSSLRDTVLVRKHIRSPSLSRTPSTGWTTSKGSTSRTRIHSMTM